MEKEKKMEKGQREMKRGEEMGSEKQEIQRLVL